MATTYDDVYYQSPDGLKLYARDYGHSSPKKTVMLLHGFTRNSADFDGLADILNEDYRVIVPDQRGRGLSDYDEKYENYNPGVYIHDMRELLDTLGVTEVHAIGTSMGGIIAMTMAAMKPGLIKTIVFNDVGPELDPDGIQRVIDYLGNKPTINTWEDAISYAKEINSIAYPDYTDEQWENFCRKIFQRTEEGDLKPAYDPGIGAPYIGFNAHESQVDLWPMFEMIKNVQFLVIRGAISDVLAPSCVERLLTYDNVTKAVEVPRIGHAPILDEPIAVEAILEFLKNN